MEQAKKIKPASWFIQIGIPIIVLVVIAFNVKGIIGEAVFKYSLASVMLLMAFAHSVFLISTKNKIYLLPICFYFFSSMTFLSSNILEKHFLTIIFSILAGIFFVLLIFVLSTRKMKWRYREILELAARSVNDTQNGYTTRPFPLGKTFYKKEEIIRFAKFLLKHAIAFPYFEKNRIVMVIPENMLSHFFHLNSNYLKSTYVAFDFRGNVIVNISEKEYQKYTQQLTFDQLCASLGNLFIEFLEMNKNEESNKLIEKLNDLKFVV